MIYFDHAASSFPKPDSVIRAVNEALTEYGANPGRGSHQLARRAAAVVNDTRVQLADFFGLSHPENVLFFSNATTALNQALLGFPLKEGDHVLATCFEHNSVRRPLEYLKKTKNIDVSYVHPYLSDWESAVHSNTKLMVAVHGSNLTGLVMPIESMALMAERQNIRFLVDASQTAGVLPIDMEKIGIDMLAFPGHKGLLGPQGTGALLIRNGIHLKPRVFGGTGAFSKNIDQPEEHPYQFESGTLNTPGIAGLRAGLMEVKNLGLPCILNHEQELAKHCIRSLLELGDIQVYSPSLETPNRLGVVSFTIDDVNVQEAAIVLDQHYDIAVRAGYHCAPLAHEAMGTEAEGTIRVSFGPYNQIQEVDELVDAIKEIQVGLKE